ncbi:MAG: beta-ketoacyl-ACP synthase II, partial [Spirochaetaceae bacterium]
MGKRVVVTGLGAISPIGNSIDEVWRNACEGNSGIGPITRFDTSDYPTKIAAEVKNFDPGDYMDRKEARKMDLFSQFGAAASLLALEDAGLDTAGIEPERLAVILGVGIGGFETTEHSYKALLEKGPGRVPPLTIPKLITNEGPANVAILTNAQGPVYAVTTACASGADAMTTAARWIRDGYGEVAISGGVEACITQLGVAGFNVLHALSTRNEEPERASRPFDTDRDGFVIGEGAGILILEELEHARARGAAIYAELAGTASTCDAYHRTSPHPEGTGAKRAMQLALGEAGIGPSEVDYINAHGTSTRVNDPVETKVIKDVFGDHARKVAVSSTKSVHGHLIGAAGGIEGVLSCLAIREQYIPPTVNLDNPDPECDLDYVPNVGRSASVEVVMSNSLGFGGHNSILIFR